MKRPGPRNIPFGRKVLVSITIASFLLSCATLFLIFRIGMAPWNSADRSVEGGGTRSPYDDKGAPADPVGRGESEHEGFPLPRSKNEQRSDERALIADQAVDPSPYWPDGDTINTVVNVENGIPSRVTTNGAPDDESGEKPFLAPGRDEEQAHDQQALETISSLLSADATLTVNIVEGGQQGFVLKDVRPNSTFDRIKLENGDIVMKVNDQDISSMPNHENAYLAFAEFVMSGEGRIEILRNGFRMTMNFHK